MPSPVQAASLHVAHYLGLNAAMGRSAWRRRRLLILCYHGIAMADEHLWNPNLFIPAETFAARMRLLRQHRCAVLSLDDAVRRVRDGDLPERAVVLTFDDGYLDFQVQAWPILRQYGFPATVYLPTSRCEHNYPVVNLAAGYIMWTRRDRLLPGGGVPGLAAREYAIATPSQRAAVLAELAGHDASWTMTPFEKDEQVRALARALEFDYDRLVQDRTFSLLTPPEVERLAREDVDFELHTHRHRSPEGPADFIEEVRENREHLERITGRPARHFCYPSGITRAGYADELREAGIVSATTTRQGLVDATTDPLLLPRFVDTTSTTDREFEAWLHGFAPWLRERKRHLGLRDTWSAGAGGSRTPAARPAER